jgi:hypothetical protein
VPDVLAATQMAAFALQAHSLGVLLPGGKFTDPTDTLKKQWRKYVEATCPSDDPLALFVGIEFTECRRRLNIEPPCRFNNEPGRVANF